MALNVTTAASGLILILALAGCASLPDTQLQLERHAAQTVSFETARGAVSPQKSAAIFAELKRKSPDLDILEKHVALEQAIVGTPLVLGNRITLLQDGPATYAAMFAAIRAARDHINMETYIFEDDDIGRQFSELLVEQQARGIQVNLIYDSVGSFGVPAAFFEPIKQSGIQLLEFNPVNPLNARGPWLINNRDHRKLLIVDGRTAFLGGINISSVYSSGPVLRRTTRPPAAGAASGHWRDTDLQIEGPAVAEFQKLFMETWEKQKGAPLADRQYFPELAPQGNEIVRAIGSTPADPFSLIYLTLISAIDNAEKQVWLTNAYFVPDPQLLQSLKGAAARGVDVRLILPGHSDSALVFNAGRSYYEDLLEGGVRLYERTGALLHAKTAVLDGVWATIGSTNLDWRSFLDNNEINAVVLSRDFGQKMQSMFTRDIEASQEIQAQAWQRRPLTMRVKEWAARLLSRML